MDVIGRMGNKGHPEEDYLERYALNRCSEQEIDAIEEHLLFCAPCRDIVTGTDQLVLDLKAGFAALPKQPPRSRWRDRFRIPWPRPMAMGAALAAVAVMAIAIPALWRVYTPVEDVVSLTATRGDARTPQFLNARHLLHLQLDTTDLVGPLECQIVTLDGVPVWRQAIPQTDAKVTPPRGLGAGVYWVRINSAETDHATLREFKIELQ